MDKKENLQVRDVFNKTNIDWLAEKLLNACPDRDISNFKKKALHNLSNLSYSERKSQIVSALESYLPSDFPKAVPILTNALPPPFHDQVISESMDRFIVVPMAEYVGIHGLKHPKLSLSALKTMTKCFSAEWAIRPFLIHQFELTLKTLHKWTSDKNAHVRRLVSEGSRPFLPWGKKLPFIDKDPQITLPLLSKLKNDPSEHVRRSVANHLNDLSKNNTDLIISQLENWNKESPSPEMTKLIKHALRTAIKKGNPRALALIGFKSGVAVKAIDVIYPLSIPLGGDFTFSLKLLSKEKKAVPIHLDFIIHYLKSNGNTQPKVFKLKSLNVSPGTSQEVRKKITFRPITTRKYYPGTHYLQFSINGEKSEMYSFDLLAP